MNRRTRRQFLEDSMFAAAAATSASYAMPVLADEQQSSSPHEKLSVAVIGVHGRGRSHLDAFLARPDAEITHICDADMAVGQRQAEKVAARQGRAPAVVQDLRKLLEDDSIDIVTVATPNHWHALAAIWAMQAGKDVYLEKPVSHNVAEGRVIVDVARKTGRICQTGTQCRSNPGMREAMEFCAARRDRKCLGLRAACAINAARPSDHVASMNRRRRWTTVCGLAPRRWRPSRDHSSTTIGIGNSPTAMATSAIRESTRWILPAGDWG